MPELPEVHTIASDLKRHLTGWCIDSVEIEKEYKVSPSVDKYAKGLVGSQITKVGRVGKNIVTRLSTGDYLTFHLAMTGRLLLHKVGSPKAAHQKVQLTMSNKNKKLLLRFCDMRMFGKTALLSPKELRTLKSKYGPDLIFQEVTTEVFLSRLKMKVTTVKNALLEQSIVAGLGNIYATDALWLAGIHPETKTSALTLESAKDLLEAAKKILLEGIAHRGSTLPDKAYVDIFGKPGNHQNHFRIYGKSYCPNCKSKVEYKKLSGRGTYFCPVCQK